MLEAKLHGSETEQAGGFRRLFKRSSRRPRVSPKASLSPRNSVVSSMSCSNFRSNCRSWAVKKARVSPASFGGSAFDLQRVREPETRRTRQALPAAAMMAKSSSHYDPIFCNGKGERFQPSNFVAKFLIFAPGSKGSTP